MLDFAALGALVISLVVGVLLGYSFRKRRRIDLSKVTLGIILVLIFSLGFNIGSNNELLNSLPKVGFEAMVIMLLAVGFSVAFVKVVGKVARLD